MYVIATHIPIYVDGDRYYTDVSWQRDLVLARDWLARPFGRLKLLAPSLPIDVGDPRVMQLLPIGRDDGILVAPSFDLRCRTREFWLSQRRRWVDDVRQALDKADVIHTSASDIYRPLAFLAHSTAARSDVTTVFVGPDSDPHVLMPEGRLYCMIFDQFMQRAVRQADLALLKEGNVYERYMRNAKNPKAFCHSMHSRQDVIFEPELEKRLATLGLDRRLKAVYAGRFIPGKGLHDAITAIGAARDKGVHVEYHLFGTGPEEESMRRQVEELNIGHLVTFHGYVEYGSQFIAQLSAFDILLFLPTREDTARMVYDAMAAGLPVLGSRNPFLTHRVKSDHMGILVDVGDSLAAADQLCRLARNRDALKSISRAARVGGNRHASEEWYRLRSEWTKEAVERHRAIQ
jgi:glycosyltransferase involved in cell wall biosynthesis